MTVGDRSVVLLVGEAFHQSEDQRSLGRAGDAVEGSVELPPFTGLEEAPKGCLLVIDCRVEDDVCLLVDVCAEPCDRDLQRPGEVDQFARRDPCCRALVKRDGPLGIARERRKAPLREPACLAMVPEAGRDGAVSVCDAMRGVGHGAGGSRRRWFETKVSVGERGLWARDSSFGGRLGGCDSSTDRSVRAEGNPHLVLYARAVKILFTLIFLPEVKNRHLSAIRSAVGGRNRILTNLLNLGVVGNMAIDAVDRLIIEQAEELSERLKRHRVEMFPPTAQKGLREFQLAEAAKFLGVTSGYLRNLSLEGKGPQPQVTPSGRRSYTAAQIEEMRRFLEQNARTGTRYVPHRRAGEHLQIIAVVNFKGGSGKTTTAAHLSQHLALTGHRVLAVDLDPQASLSAIHGVQPEFDVGENETLFGAIRYDDERRPLQEIIRKTNFPNLDLVPGNLELMEFEHDTPRVLAQGRSEEYGRIFFARLDDALVSVADQYDVVVIDCPPQLGFLTMSAICGATAVLITVHPQMLDVMSMCQFLQMMGEVLSTLKEAGGNMNLDWLRYLITRYDPQDGPQTQMVAFMRSLFKNLVLTNPMVRSVAISDAAMTNQTLYEVDRSSFTRSTYDRAMEAMEAVNGEIVDLIHAAWGRG